MLAVYPYQAKAIKTYKSPGISFQESDTITIESAADEEGDWLNGVTANSSSGAFPSSFVTKLEATDDIADVDEQIVVSEANKKEQEVASKQHETESVTAPTTSPPSPATPALIPLSSSARSEPTVDIAVLPEANGSAPIPTSPLPTSTAPPASPQKQSLKEKIAALNASGAGATAPPTGRPKPPVKNTSLSLGSAAKSTPSLPSASIPATTPAAASPTPALSKPALTPNPPAPISGDSVAGQMSATDAAESIGKGGSLKDRIAALKGLQLETPGAPGRPPKPFKKPSLDAAKITKDDTSSVEDAQKEENIKASTGDVEKVQEAVTAGEDKFIASPSEPTPASSSITSSPVVSTTPSITAAPATSTAGVLPSLPKKAGGKPKRRAPTPAIPLVSPILDPVVVPGDLAEAKDDIVEEKNDMSEEMNVEGIAREKDTTRGVDKESIEQEVDTVGLVEDKSVEVKQDRKETVPETGEGEEAEYATSSPVVNSPADSPSLSAIDAIIPAVVSVPSSPARSSSRPPVPPSFISPTLPSNDSSITSIHVDRKAERDVVEQELPVAPRSKIPSIPPAFSAPTRSAPIAHSDVVGKEDKVTNGHEGEEEEDDAEGGEIEDKVEVDESSEKREEEDDVVPTTMKPVTQDDENEVEPAMERDAAEEEDPEVIRRRALAKRMAALGGRSMMPPMMGLPLRASPASSPLPCLFRIHSLDDLSIANVFFLNLFSSCRCRARCSATSETCSSRRRVSIACTYRSIASSDSYCRTCVDNCQSRTDIGCRSNCRG
jgi:hypothetical protein